MPANVPGFSLSFNDRIVIAFESDTSTFHQKYIVFHELGHVLFRHNLLQTLQVIPLDISLEAEGIKSAFARSGYLEEPEQEAEVFASLLLQRVASTPVVPTRYQPGDPRIKQLEDFMAGLV
jgi:Zn-dependent peptidase ImmA (M78 family)